MHLYACIYTRNPHESVPIIPTYLPTYLPTSHLPTSLPTYLPTSLPHSLSPIPPSSLPPPPLYPSLLRRAHSPWLSLPRPGQRQRQPRPTQLHTAYDCRLQVSGLLIDEVNEVR
jgi:hypothetical protein